MAAHGSSGFQASKDVVWLQIVSISADTCYFTITKNLYIVLLCAVFYLTAHKVPVDLIAMDT